MPLAGETIIAGKIPGERIATTIRTAIPTGVTAETVMDTVIAPVVINRIYRVRWVVRISSSVAGDDALANLREDSVSGTVLNAVSIDLPILNRWPFEVLEAEYSADATEDKTFVGTLQRVAGTGTISISASSTVVTYLYVDYIRGG